MRVREEEKARDGNRKLLRKKKKRGKERQEWHDKGEMKGRMRT